MPVEKQIEVEEALQSHYLGSSSKNVFGLAETPGRARERKKEGQCDDIGM